MYPDPLNCNTEVHYDLSECVQRKTHSSPPFSSPLLRLTDAIRSIRVGPARPPKGRPLERGVPCPVRPLPACDVCCLFLQLDMRAEGKSAMSVFGSTVNSYSDSVLDHGSSNLIGEITRVLYKEEEAHPFIKPLLTGTLNEFSRIAGRD